MRVRSPGAEEALGKGGDVADLDGSEGCTRITDTLHRLAEATAMKRGDAQDQRLEPGRPAAAAVNW